MIASVAVFAPFSAHERVFDYDVPENLAVQAGSFVRVPLENNDTMELFCL